MHRISPLPMLINSLCGLVLVCMGYVGYEELSKPISPAQPNVLVQASIELESGQWGNLFGQSPISDMNQYQLRGTITAGNSAENIAILAKQGGEDQVALVGQHLGDDYALSEIHSDHVVLNKRGVAHRVPLSQPEPVVTFKKESYPSEHARYNITRARNHGLPTASLTP